MILAIETSTPYYEVGLRDERVDVTISGSRYDAGFDGLPGLAATLLAQVGRSTNSITRILVDQGPGNLISVRSGLAYANALAFALAVDVLPFVSTDLVASQAMHRFPGRNIVAVRGVGPTAEGRLFVSTGVDGTFRKSGRAIGSEDLHTLVAGLARPLIVASERDAPRLSDVKCDIADVGVPPVAAMYELLDSEQMRLGGSASVPVLPLGDWEGL